MRVYKGVTVFDWDHEPTDMRPSAFVESTQHSTHYDSVWAPSTQTRASMLERRRPRPPRKRGGMGTGVVLGVLAVGVAFGAWHWRTPAAVPAAAPEAAPAPPTKAGTVSATTPPGPRLR